MVLPTAATTTTTTSTPERAPRSGGFFVPGNGNVLQHFAGLTSPDPPPPPPSAPTSTGVQLRQRRTMATMTTTTGARALDARLTTATDNQQLSDDDDEPMVGSGSTRLLPQPQPQPLASRKLSNDEFMGILKHTKEGLATRPRSNNGGSQPPTSGTGSNGNSSVNGNGNGGVVMGRERRPSQSHGRHHHDNQMPGDSVGRNHGGSPPPKPPGSGSRRAIVEIVDDGGEVPPPPVSLGSLSSRGLRTAATTESRFGSSGGSARGSETMALDGSYTSDSFSLLTSMQFLSRDLSEEERANKSKSDRERAYLYKKRYMDVYGLAAGLSRRVTELEHTRLSKMKEIQMLKDAISKQAFALEMLKEGSVRLSENAKEVKIQELCKEIGVLARQLSERDSCIDNLQNEREESVRTLNELRMSYAALQSSGGSAKNPTSSDHTAALVEIQEKLHRVEQEKLNAVTQAESLTVKVAQLEHRLQSSDSERIQIQNSMHQTEQQLEAVHTQWLKEKSDLLESLDDTKKRLGGECERLRRENMQLKKALQKTSESEHSTKSKIAEAEMNAVEAKKYIAALESQILDGEARISAFAEKEALLEELRRELEETRQNLATSTAENQNLLQTVSKLTEDLEHARSGFKLRMEKLERRIYQAEIVRRSLHNKVMELKGNIRVFCRVRPVLNDELRSNGKEEIFNFPDYAGERRQIELIAGPKAHVGYGQNGSRDTVKKYPFDFDLVFNGDCGQEDVFLEVSALIQSALDGFDVCIFAYGQTGSGKTYTMQGLTDSQSHISSTHMGIVGRAISHIYATIADLRSSGWEFSVALEMIEIYNETLRDLLAPPGSADKVELRLDGDGKPTITNSCIHSIEDEQAAWVLMDKAISRRATKTTNMNDRSSRSHCVISFRLNGTNTLTGDVRTSVVHLVDLAGSERLSKSGSGNDKELLKEAQCINKSLSSLGNVIGALARKSTHVPFRDSKLTHFLSPSLGGDSKTLMICNLSPLRQHRDETLNSLRFAKTVNSCEIAYPSYGSRS